MLAAVMLVVARGFVLIEIVVMLGMKVMAGLEYMILFEYWYFVLLIHPLIVLFVVLLHVVVEQIVKFGVDAKIVVVVEFLVVLGQMVFEMTALALGNITTVLLSAVVEDTMFAMSAMSL